MFILSKNLENPTNLASFSKNLVYESCPRVHIAYPVRKYNPIDVLWESNVKKKINFVQYLDIRQLDELDTQCRAQNGLKMTLHDL